MIEAVNSFIHALKKQTHILPLIHQKELTVNLKTNDEIIQLSIQKGQISIMTAGQEQPTIFEISGNPDNLNRLLTGKERLRTLERSGNLTVTAPLRTILLLESIFFLTQSDRYLEKII
ncbi:SCP2 sterol-binding domain-containing protein [Neobacillus mesonae]|uniref:SCP2 sterol-binding domain-containing protein n=1 Tax=Neobacillus mesonae TaxID=1193713 RepID=UPI00203AC471|nr:SCP2 sterol-binding domain-containing protein [Neobacillus mesonae]MCM3567532.1 SCP2 sterol-binding domain-containing protein [Neobacillus mesonae]